MPGKRFHHSTPVRFADLDALGHVNNVKYLTYVEEARMAMLAQLDDDGADRMSRHAIIARAEFDYLKQVRLTRKPIDLAVWVSKIGTSSFTLEYELEHKGELVGRSRTVVVRFDYENGRPQPLTDNDRAALERWRTDGGVTAGS